MKEGIIGILGGMGPAATAGLFQKIIKTTRAAREGHTDIVRLLREAGAKE
jgi:aspartate/glutamate racemase